MREEQCLVSSCVLIVLLVCPGPSLSPSELWVDRREGWLVCKLSHKLAASRIWKESFTVKAANITVGLDFISSDYLLMICSSFCGILFGAAGIRFILSQESQWVPDISKCVFHISGHFCCRFLSFIFLCCFFICPVWKTLPPSTAVLEVALRTIKPSSIFWRVKCKSGTEITDTKQGMIQHGRQEVWLHSP